VRDYAGFDTWDSCAQARQIFGVARATVVTQRFHLPRAVTLRRAAGIDAHGVGHDSMPIRADVTQYGCLREGSASTKAIADVLTRPRPRFLGPRETAGQRALGE
jgi:vancomycin permeability regulator SanA